MIETPKPQKAAFNTDEYHRLIREIKAGKSGYLSLFIGPYIPDKQKALGDITSDSTFKPQLVETAEYVTLSFEKTKRNLDELFENTDSTTLFYFVNGDRLCGVYTGFTQSKVKYATPQERYFFKKITHFQGVAIIDIADMDAVDNSLLRACNAIIEFPLPKSPVSRFLYGLRNYSFHGYNFRTKRPEKYTA